MSVRFLLIFSVVALAAAFAGYPETAALAGGKPGSQSAAVLTLDPATTQIHYTLQGWPHVTYGTFRLDQGVIRIDPATGKTAGKIVVSAASGDSGSAMRDREMKHGILDVQDYPDIVFTPESAQGHRTPQGAFPAIVYGALSLRGESHPFTMNVSVQSDGNNFTVTTRFAIPYVAWGLKNPSILVFRCADTVYVDVSAQGRVTWESAATAAGSPRASAQ
jgi:polyisoprenoid-binding protein YceI